MRFALVESHAVTPGFSEQTAIVEANSPIEAVKKVAPALADVELQEHSCGEAGVLVSNPAEGNCCVVVVPIPD